MTARFELSGSMSVDLVPDVRKFVERMLAEIEDRDLRSRLVMATHELLENAVKFAIDHTVSFQLEQSDVGGVAFRITTRNRATGDDLRQLHRIASRMRETTDVFEFYLDLMRNPLSGRGGLGIGRVAAEGEMKLDMELADDVVVIRAELAA